MAVSFKRLEEKYGSEAAKDMERELYAIIDDEIMPQLAELQRILTEHLAYFRAEEMLPATELQKRPFKSIRDELIDHRKIMLLYNSAPTAVLFHLGALAEIEENFSAIVAALHWEAHEGRDVSPDEFWSALDRNAPESESP